MKAEDSGYVIAHAQNEIDPRIAVPGRDTTQYLLHDDTLVQSSWNNLDYPLQIDEPDVVRSQFPLEFYNQELCAESTELGVAREVRPADARMG